MSLLHQFHPSTAATWNQDAQEEEELMVAAVKVEDVGFVVLGMDCTREEKKEAKEEEREAANVTLRHSSLGTQA